MAYLNVRERRIEAKIAWVGPELDAVAATFDRLGSAGNGIVDASAKDVVSLSWTAAAHPRFRDCGVKIDLVGFAGAVADERVKRLTDDVDGIVFVADPSAALETNRALFEALKAAKSSVPVVQASGDVVETLELALAEVLASLEKNSSNGVSTSGTGNDGTPPLLGALKRILVEAVDHHVEALEPRFVAGRDGVFKRMEGALAKLVERATIGEKQLTGLRDRLDALAGASVAKTDLTAAVTRIQRLREEIGAEVVRALEGQRRAEREQLTAMTNATAKSIDAVGERIVTSAKTSSKNAADVEASVETLRAESAETFGKIDAKIDALQGTLDSLIEELKKPKKGWFT